MKMKKILAAALAAVCALTLMSGCGSSSDGPAKQPTAAQVTEKVWEFLVFKDTVVEVEDDLVKNYYNIDWDKVEDKCMYTSGSRATAEEVMVIKMKDAADVQLAKDAMRDRVEDQKIAYENYVPEEMTKLNNALICENGPYVLLVVADDTENAQTVFDEQFK